MEKTVGSVDRVLRIMLAAGAVLGSWALGFSSGWGVVLLVVAAVMALTGATAYCPLYSILGISTRGTEQPGTQLRGMSHLHRAA